MFSSFFRKERRAGDRFRPEAGLMIEVTGSRWQAAVVDLSVTGLSFRSKLTFQTGQMVKLSLPVADNPAWRLELEAEVMHSKQGVTGLQFRGLSETQRAILPLSRLQVTERLKRQPTEWRCPECSEVFSYAKNGDDQAIVAAHASHRCAPASAEGWKHEPETASAALAELFR